HALRGSPRDVGAPGNVRVLGTAGALRRPPDELVGKRLCTRRVSGRDDLSQHAGCRHVHPILRLRVTGGGRLEPSGRISGVPHGRTSPSPPRGRRRQRDPVYHRVPVAARAASALWKLRMRAALTPRSPLPLRDLDRISTMLAPVGWGRTRMTMSSSKPKTALVATASSSP